MIFNGKEIEFPAIGKISFYKVLDSLEQMAQDKNNSVADPAKSLLEEVNKFPELREGFENIDDFGKYKEPIRKLCQLMFPEVLMTNEIKALTPPFLFKPLYCSTRFKNITKATGDDFSFFMKDITEDQFYLFCCYFILATYYGYPSHGGGPLLAEIKNSDSDISRSYHVAINADMMEFIPTEKAVDITREDFELLVDNHEDIDLWKEKFPPNSWIMRGVSLVNMMDVTNSQALSKITSNLLIKSEESLIKIREGMQSLFNNPDLTSGVIILENGKLAKVHDQEMKSIILGDQPSIDCAEGMCGYSFDKLLNKNAPLIIPNVERFHEKSGSYLSQCLKESNMGSYIMIPLSHEEELLGFLELGSPRPYELNTISLSKLEPLIPILSMAMKRFKTEAQNLVEAIIQQECTTIHHSVKWRFEEEAKNFIQARLDGSQPMFKDIIFKDVIPLYGQLDIKGSSVKRNDAIKADLLKQIKGIRKVLSGALKHKGMPVLEELMFRLDNYRNDIRSGMSSGSENKIQGFLNSDIIPVFDQLKKDGGEMATLVANYESILDPKLATVYEQRKKFDTSVNVINQTLASLLDEKQVEAQAMFPHYFERYKTDGVEYNMYIGQSISGKREFDKIYHDNLKLWQLLVTCELERRFEELKKDIETPLEIASLILVYSNSLSVHFRMDEKRFDVEGAYNARYEIVKKRVDKAHIKGTKERITAPGKVAIIYSNDQDANEYRGYIEFLEAKGYLKNNTLEYLELEDLQGISGLRALRTEVNYSPEKITPDLSIEKLLEGIKRN